MKSKLRITAVLFVFIGLVAALWMTNAEAARRPVGPRWVLLGVRSVTDKLDHDTVAVTAARGDFHSIKITVQGRAVQLHDVKVHFGDGETQDVQVRSVIPAGGESRVIDLEGRDRVIRSVEFWYDAQSLAGRRATVRLFGRH
jgi:hypothetical protein